MKFKGLGFTIVELLIVIVIIGILAAISLVAYNGIQQRANNSSRIANASAAIKLINAYTTTYGAYPTTTANSCVGNGFPIRQDLGYAVCWGYDSSTPSNRNATFNDTELRKIGSLPNNTTPGVVTPFWTGLGPVWIYDPARTVDGASRPAMILYFLDGANKECSVGDIIRQTSGNAWASVTTTPRMSSTHGNSTFCYAALSNP
jgi:prepilin-type N-terminal cleavage/methylation domain-containing protein